MAIEKQMEMFDDGGLMDEGGSVDPVSGNDVPSGSTKEEVRDDIPAQLSEGEFVLPADVVRYHGLEKIMELRDEAKQGLQRMEDMGQMGNADEATIPDGIPFDINDLDIDDTLEYNQGGVVMQPGFTGIQTTQPSQFQNYQGQFVPYQPASVATPAASQQYVSPTYVPPTQAVTPVLQQQQLPEFQNFISTPTGGYDELREYRNATTGEIRQIPFVNGQPIYPIPEGFTYVDPEATKTEEVTTTPTTVQTTRVREEGDDGPKEPTPGLFRTFDAEGKQTTFGITPGVGTDIASIIDPMSKVSVGLDQQAINDLSAAGIDVLGIQNKTLGTQTKFSGSQLEALQPHLNRLAFQNRVKDVEQSDAFKDLASIIDDRSILDKVKDAVVDVAMRGTTSAEYSKAVREMAVSIANASESQSERDDIANRVADMLRDPENQKTRTELGMDLAPVMTGKEYEAQKTLARDIERNTARRAALDKITRAAKESIASKPDASTPSFRASRDLEDRSTPSSRVERDVLDRVRDAAQDSLDRDSGMSTAEMAARDYSGGDSRGEFSGSGGFRSQATGDRTSSRVGFDKGGIAKQMKKSGLSSKK